MAKFTVSEVPGFEGNRVFKVEWFDSHYNWKDYTHVWYDGRLARCCHCQGALVAMRSDCRHAKAVKRFIRKEPLLCVNLYTAGVNDTDYAGTYYRADEVDGKLDEVRAGDSLIDWVIKKIQVCHPDIKFSDSLPIALYTAMHVLSSRAKMYENYLATRKNDVAELEDKVAVLESQLTTANAEIEKVTAERDAAIEAKLQAREESAYAIKSANEWADRCNTETQRWYQEKQRAEAAQSALTDTLAECDGLRQSLAALQSQALAEGNEFARDVFRDLTIESVESGWYVACSPYVNPFLDKMAERGLLEHHPTNPNRFRWLEKDFAEAEKVRKEKADADTSNT
jgi:hypothetical protein